MCAPKKKDNIVNCPDFSYTIDEEKCICFDGFYPSST
jgi:hypothetical protein